MPKLAMMMKQGKVVEWRVKEGERINKGQVIMVIETEKVTYDIEASVSGYFHIVTKLDETVPVDHVVAWIAESEEELKSLQAQSPAPAADEEISTAAEKTPSVSAQAPSGRQGKNFPGRQENGRGSRYQLG